MEQVDFSKPNSPSEVVDIVNVDRTPYLESGTRWSNLRLPPDLCHAENGSTPENL
jgi:hypothetical protein